MKIFVTGATGFIGKHLVMALHMEGHDVTISLREGESSPFIDEIKAFYFNESAIKSNIVFFKEERFDGLIHLASLYLTSHKPEDVKQLIESNIRFGSIILDCACKAKIKWFINTGTSWQNYQNANYSPVNLYAATKQAFEDIAKYYIETNQITFCTLKLFDTYGPGDTRPKIFNLWKQIAETGEALDMSPGEQIIDVSFIDDIVSAFVILANLLDNNTLSITNGTTFTVNAAKRYKLKELATIFESVVGTQMNIRWGEKPYRDREVMVPVDSVNPVPGWSPTYSIIEGLNHMLGKKRG